MKRPHKHDRRAVLGATAAAGGLAAAATLLPAAKTVAPDASAQAGDVKAEPSLGYQLTEHVKRYYTTARI